MKAACIHPICERCVQGHVTLSCNIISPCCVQDIAIVTGAEFIAKDLGMKVGGQGKQGVGWIRMGAGACLS